MFEIVLRTIINVHVNIILDFPITYINASVLNLPIGMRMSTSNSKHSSFPNKIIMKILPKKETTHVNVQSCPSHKKSELQM